MKILEQKIIISKGIAEELNKFTKGEIHSKFKNSFNIKLGNFLINFSDNEDNLSSFGILINKDSLNYLLEQIEIGDIVVFKKKSFIFYTNNYNVVKVNISIDNIYDNYMENQCISYKQLNKLSKFMEKIDFDNELGIELHGKNLKKLNVLSDRGSDSIEVENSINYLIGRGKGLTPSGDDILMGYYFIIQALGLEKYLINIKVENLSTTDISKEYLKKAFEGYYNRIQIELINNLKNDNDENIAKYLNKIANIGHTSGVDFLYGMSLGIRLCKI